VDTSKLQISELATEQAIESAFKTARDEFDAEIRKRIKRPALGLDGSSESTTVLPFLNSCRELVQEKLEKSANGYSALRWLWYLRRLPVYRGKNTPFAEIISGWSKTFDESKVRKDLISYDIHESDIRRVLRFWGGTHYLSDIYGLMREAGVRVGFHFGVAALPEPRRLPAQEQAMSLFDDRIKREGIPVLSGTGTVVTSNALSGQDWSNCLLAVNRYREELASGERYQAAYFKLDELNRLNADPGLAGKRWWQPEAGGLLLLLRMAGPLLASLEGSGLGDLHQYGYLIVEEGDFNQAVDAGVGKATELVQAIVPNTTLPTNADELKAVLEQSYGTLWPSFAGPAIRREGRILCIDLFFATLRLHRLFEYPRETGPVANARAVHFEHIVQGVIDSSSWAPTDDLEKLARRSTTLRRGKQDFMQIDAIGSRGNILLIVDCMSTYISSEYETGNPKVLLNTASNIEEKVIEWKRKKALLEDAPIGSNYDLSRFKGVIAVVCTPVPLHVPLGVATEDAAPGLKAAVCLSELNCWLTEVQHSVT
jgi:hypothetical protein